MRFFSNDARESTDEQAHDERPERVQSDPVAVPGQRPPSPWSNTPATDDPAAADTDRRDGVEDSDADADRTETDAPPFHEPSQQPTAFGAPTVGGAAAVSATANPEDDRRDATDRDPAADSGVGDDASAAPGDRVVTSSTSTYAGSTASTAPDTVPATWTEHGGRNGHDHGEPDGAVDLPLDDKRTTDSDATPADTDRDPDTSTTPDTDQAKNEEDTVTLKSDTLKDDAVDQHPDDSTVEDSDRPGPEAVAATDADPKTDADSKTDAGPLKDDGDFDDPKAVDPVTDTPLDADRTPDDSPSDDSPAQSTPAEAVAVPVAAAVAAPAATTDTLFDREDARTFQERWRDVQLRFVDSPKDAATEAAGLVDEAVEKLTSGLRSQRDGLTNDTEDTEQLRVQLRGYRDILNRILSL
ncbi:hypothetical protein DMB66_37690 [Actinoplanes sp. ATCC 53533]|uniref:hypothetical protein n=1 Tax=Actinoplanes sp. ATCC 53533 TaxID=1288362 RepID=UPI000F76CFC2|nr:hypothetical protein [Actinoplanes sp. ATCC 53533]RSM54077.1 hypothetical protein DMB66_37690 [Actinoplanes sp. ATCC 53533]